MKAQALSVLKENGVIVRELPDGQYMAKLAPVCGYSFGDWETFASLVGVCDRFARYCESDAIYNFCAGIEKGGAL
jgi:hypothetical protein